MNISVLRSQYHEHVCNEIIRISKGDKKKGYPNFADGNHAASVQYAWGILNRLPYTENTNKLEGQTAGIRFEKITKDFIQDAFVLLQHIRPGEFDYFIRKPISFFAQYRHLDYIARAFKKDTELASAFGGDYLINPDIVIGKKPISDTVIDEAGILRESLHDHAKYTVLREHNSSHQILHAIISCKWTIRSDRVQNTRTEVLNLIRNRKGHLPHVVAITAEPWPARIAGIALGTGDIDCVYHFALPELIETVEEVGNADAIEMLNMMVGGERLRDISDLPFDLAV